MDILLVGREQSLLQSRRMLLETYFEVKCAARASEVRSLLAAYPFRIVVLCDTLSDVDRIEVSELARRQEPVPEIFAILPPLHSSKSSVVGKPLDLSDGPLALVRECASVLGIVSQRRKGGHSEASISVKSIYLDSEPSRSSHR